VRGLEPEAPREPGCEIAEDVALRLLELDAGDVLRSGRVPEIGEQAYAIGLDEEDRVRASKAGQVADVRRVCDEQRLLERSAKAFDAVVHARRPATRNSSASR
jgi:hypothetical protein